MQMVRSHLLLPILLPLLAAALFGVPAACLPAPRAADGALRGWSIVGLAAHPLRSTAYLVDSYGWIRAVDGLTGGELPRAVSVSPWSVRALAVDGARDVVHALTGAGARYPDLFDTYVLVTLSGDLQPVANVSLADALSPPVRGMERLHDSVLVDSSGCVYVFHRLTNSSLLVHVLLAGKQIDAWMAPIPASTPSGWPWLSASAMGPGDLLYFQQFPSDGSPQPLYIATTGGLLAGTLQLNGSSAVNTQRGALAVSPTTGDIAVTVGKSVALFDSTGARKQAFKYVSPLQASSGIDCLAFDASGRVLAVDAAADFAIEVLSSTSGDVLASWSSAVPRLVHTNSLLYEQRTNTLLADSYLRDVPTMRLEAEHGWLVQEYPFSSRRFTDCFELASAIGASGDVYRLADCAGQSGRQVVLQAVSRAGQLRREVAVQGQRGDLLQDALVVSEERGLFYLLPWDPRQLSKNGVLAFAFNGTYSHNFSDPQIGFIGVTGYAALRRVDDGTLAVIDQDSERIVLLGLDTASLVRNIWLPSNVLLLDAVCDRTTWYRSELQFSNKTWTFSINQYAADDDSLLAQYAVDQPSNMWQVVQPLAVDSSGRRLFGFQGPAQYESSGRLMWWNTQPRDGEQRALGEGVRRVQASGDRAMDIETGADQKVAGDCGTVGERQMSRARGEKLLDVMSKRRDKTRPERLKQLGAEPAETQ